MFLVSCESGGSRAPAHWLEATRAEFASGGTSSTRVSRRNTLASSRKTSGAETGSVATLDRVTHSTGGLAGSHATGMGNSGRTSRKLACDIHARYAARRIAENLGVPLIENEYSLECVDVSRSPRHRQLFSSASKSLPLSDRKWLMDHIYNPYRQRVRGAIEKGLRRGTYLIHLSVRTFAASSKGRMRRTDVGLLYDPAQEDELNFCLDWMDQLWDITPMLRVRRNYPRRGTHDSLTRAMRAEFAGQPYLGIEVVLNRAWAGRQLKVRDVALDGLSDALLEIFSDQGIEAA